MTTPLSPVETVMTAPLATIDHTASLQQAAEALAADVVGALVVMHGTTLVGLLSERDVVAHLALGTDPTRITVGEVMQVDVLTTSRTSSVRHAARLMVEAGVRHLPVRDGDAVVGMVSVRDLVTVI